MKEIRSLFQCSRLLKAALPAITIFLVLTSNIPTFAQDPVAKVNNSVLIQYDLDTAYNQIRPKGAFHGKLTPDKKEKYRLKAVEKMIETELFYQEALDRGFKIEASVIDNEIKKVSARIGGKKQFDNALQKSGLSEDQYREKLKKKHLAGKIVESQIKEKARVSKEEVKDYYDKHRKKYMRPEARRITHILISVEPSASEEGRQSRKERAEAVLEKIKSGEDMSVLAWDYSDDAYKVKGGDMGLIHKGRLDPDFEKVVFTMNAGQLSDIFQTRFGYHIVRVDEVKQAEQLELEEVASKIETDLYNKKKTRLHGELVKRLKSRSRIEIY